MEGKWNAARDSTRQFGADKATEEFTEKTTGVKADAQAFGHEEAYIPPHVVSHDSCRTVRADDGGEVSEHGAERTTDAPGGGTIDTVDAEADGIEGEVGGLVDDIVARRPDDRARIGRRSDRVHHLIREGD